MTILPVKQMFSWHIVLNAICFSRVANQSDQDISVFHSTVCLWFYWADSDVWCGKCPAWLVWTLVRVTEEPVYVEP